VIDWSSDPKDGMARGRQLRQGTNGWTCMPDVPGRPRHKPMCVDETMMKWLIATLDKRDVHRVGLSYMLMGEMRQSETCRAISGTRVDHYVSAKFLCCRLVGPHVGRGIRRTV